MDFAPKEDWAPGIGPYGRATGATPYQQAQLMLMVKEPGYRSADADAFVLESKLRQRTSQIESTGGAEQRRIFRPNLKR